jgi:GNAT superfamily N-acetyltransferase
MSVEFSVVRDVAGLRELTPAWRELATGGGAGALFRGPEWILPWWQAYREILGAELHVMAGWADGELVCLAPLYVRTNPRALPKVRELRMLGDAGPRPPALDFLVKPGFEDKAGAQLARAIAEVGKTWDAIDLEPLADPSRIRANFVARLGSAGFTVESAPAGGGARRIALGLARAPTEDGLTTSAAATDAAAIRKGMSALRRLSRLEWAERDEQSPLADPEASALLEEVAIALGREGRARLATRDDDAGETIAAALVVDDGDRAVVLAMAIDPEHVGRGAAERLIAAEATAARGRGRVALDVVTGAAEYPLPPLPVSRQGAVAVTIWNATRTASVSRRVETVRRGARAVRETPGVAAAQARAAWARIRSAATEVAHYQRLHLYRGQMWSRGIAAPADLTIAPLDLAGFDALTPAARAELVGHLNLDEERARATWQRGDQAWVAHLGERPAGIAWAARGPVAVPELARSLSLTKYEAYVHDVFVAPAARGRAVAPAMLERLALDLRELDVYRSWALIGHGHQASIRAFAKASFTPVCDVIYARVGGVVERVLCRPPDPEAKHLLGLGCSPRQDVGVVGLARRGRRALARDPVRVDAGQRGVGGAVALEDPAGATATGELPDRQGVMIGCPQRAAHGLGVGDVDRRREGAGGQAAQDPGAAVGLRRRDRGRLQEHVGAAVAVEVADRGPVAGLGQGGADRGRRQRGGAREATGAAADDVAGLGDRAVL